MNLQELEEQISSLTLLQATELVKNLEKRLGVSAHAAQMVLPTQTVEKIQEVAEQTEFSVILKSSGEKKINVIKAVRELTTLGLKEAKDFVDTLPKAVKEGITKSEAEKISKVLTDAGASVEIK